MSTRAPATLSATATECSFDHCEESIPDHGGIRGGKFCSRTCRYRDIAHGLLKTIKFDHRYCASCYRQIREVYPPGRWLHSSAVIADGEDDPVGTMNDVPDFAIGRAYPTPETLPGLSEHLKPENPTEGEWSFVPDDLEHQRMVCACGAGHHQTVNRPLPLDELMDTAKRLSGTLDTLLREDKHPWHHDRDVLLDEVRERKTVDDPGNVDDQLTLIEALAEAIMGAKPYA